FVHSTSLATIYPLSLHDALPISDRMNRLLLVTFVALFLLILSIFINFPFATNFYIAIASFFAIALQFTLYPLSVAIANDNIDEEDRKSTRLISSHVSTSYAVFCC